MGPVSLCQQFVSSSMEDEWPTVNPGSTSSTGLSQITFLLLSPPLSSRLIYLISPHARPLHVPCHACFLLPILSSAHVVDSILICLVSRPHSVHLSQQRAISGVCFDQILTSTLSAEFTDPSLEEEASISDVSI